MSIYPNHLLLIESSNSPSPTLKLPSATWKTGKSLSYVVILASIHPELSFRAIELVSSSYKTKIVSFELVPFNFLSDLKTPKPRLFNIPID